MTSQSLSKCTFHHKKCVLLHCCRVIFAWQYFCPSTFTNEFNRVVIFVSRMSFTWLERWAKGARRKWKWRKSFINHIIEFEIQIHLVFVFVDIISGKNHILLMSACVLTKYYFKTKNEIHKWHRPHPIWSGDSRTLSKRVQISFFFYWIKLIW